MILGPRGILDDSENKSGYSQVWIGGVHYQVHVIIARVFLKNPESKPLVNHIDRNKRNNMVSNLEWVTNRENAMHYFYDNLFRLYDFEVGETVLYSVDRMYYEILSHSSHGVHAKNVDNGILDFLDSKHLIKI